MSKTLRTLIGVVPLGLYLFVGLIAWSHLSRGDEIGGPPGTVNASVGYWINGWNGKLDYELLVDSPVGSHVLELKPGGCIRGSIEVFGPDGKSVFGLAAGAQFPDHCDAH